MSVDLNLISAQHSVLGFNNLSIFDDLLLAHCDLFEPVRHWIELSIRQLDLVAVLEVPWVLCEAMQVDVHFLDWQITCVLLLTVFDLEFTIISILTALSRVAPCDFLDVVKELLSQHLSVDFDISVVRIAILLQE